MGEPHKDAVDNYRKSGYVIVDDFLSQEECTQYLNAVAAFREKTQLKKIYRAMKNRPLNYRVIDGESIEKYFPEIHDLYHNRVNQFINGLSIESLTPLENKLVGVNINIMPAGNSSYRWHYDRTKLTAILYLNGVEGGETVFYSNYRILLKNKKWGQLQKLFDYFLQIKCVRKLFGNKNEVTPKAGRLVVMRANCCWHSVRPVVGQQDRINIILAYDSPGQIFPIEKNLDKYLYTEEKIKPVDPNYK